MTTATVLDRAHAWIIGDDTGMSSKTIWAVMMGQKADRHSHPHDGGDLGRCLRLLALIPEWKGRMAEMAALSPYWAVLVDHWEELESLHAKAERQKTGRLVYDRMRELLDPVEKQDRSVFRLGEGVTVRFGR